MSYVTWTGKRLSIQEVIPTRARDYLTSTTSTDWRNFCSVQVVG